MRQRGLFVAGSDTEVGKTYVAAQIARILVQQGHRVGVYKPVASGCDPAQSEQHDGWVLWDAAGRPGRLEDVCPQTFVAPLAPHRAAEAEGRTVCRRLLYEGIRAWDSAEVVVVEGAGGLMTPLDEETYVADLASEFGWPLVIVAPNQLGVINQTLQTLITAATFGEGLPIAGIVLNDVRPGTQDASRRTNAEELAERCVPPLLAVVPWHDPLPLHRVDWYRLANETSNDSV
jgi:dethiobiotin synthetase